MRATLAVNAGSSSVKCALFTHEVEPRPIARHELEGTASSVLPALLAWLDARARDIPLAAIGHRIVHGGPKYSEPQRVTVALLDDLRRLIPFAPNHLPDEIGLIEAIGRHLPDVPQFVCFDTAFHHTLPDVAKRLPIPASFDAQGVRRYGFHGLSYAYLTEALRRTAGTEAATGRVILAHLGNGSSLAALRDGRSVDTTMAFTPMGGVIMSTRSGDLDPGVVTYLARTGRLSPDDVEDLLSHRAGLLGVSGMSGDMRELLAREATDPGCALAVAMFVYAVQKAIGSLTVVLRGCDTIVFAGGIGEHAAVIRARICEGLAFLGVQIDQDLNAAHAPLVSPPGAAIAVRVIPTDEALMIARAASTLPDSGNNP